MERAKERGAAYSKPIAALPSDFVAKSKFQDHEFPTKNKDGKKSLIRLAAAALSKSPVSLTLGDEAPHVFIRKQRLRPSEFFLIGAKRLFTTQFPRKRI
jgi:hypothetical protein